MDVSQIGTIASIPVIIALVEVIKMLIIKFKKPQADEVKDMLIKHINSDALHHQQIQMDTKEIRNDVSELSKQILKLVESQNNLLIKLGVIIDRLHKD